MWLQNSEERLQAQAVLRLQEFSTLTKPGKRERVKIKETEMDFCVYKDDNGEWVFNDCKRNGFELRNRDFDKLLSEATRGYGVATPRDTAIRAAFADAAQIYQLA